MGIQQKITGLFLLVSTLIYSQEKPSYFQPSLLRASATIAPTRFYNQHTTVACINGFIEYICKFRENPEIFGNPRINGRT